MAKFMKQVPEELMALTDLACKNVGGKALYCTDEWFAKKDRLLLPEAPVWNEDFTEYGKWMDGWESRRKRVPGYDWAIIELGLPGVIAGVDIDTCWFTGNFAPRTSLQAYALPAGEVMTEEMMGSASEGWVHLLPMTECQAGYEETRHHVFRTKDTAPEHAGKRWTHLRLCQFPDGGIARLRVYGTVVVDFAEKDPSIPLDLLAVENGGVAVGCSNQHFGHPRNLGKMGLAPDMGDGWETARHPSRPAILEMGNDGNLKLNSHQNDWSILKLGCAGIAVRMEVDTNHFKGNFPESCLVETCTFHGTDEESKAAFADGGSGLAWKTLLKRTKCVANDQRTYGKEDLSHSEAFTHVRLTIFPDGGVSRLRLWCNFCPAPSKL